MGEPVTFEYKLHWFQEGKPGARTPPAGYAMATRVGRSATQESDLVRFWVDFTGNYLNNQRALPDIDAEITVGAGAKLMHKSVEKNPYNGTWRVAFAIKPDGSGTPVELRCYLKKPPHHLSETWSYLWTP